MRVLGIDRADKQRWVGVLLDDYAAPEVTLGRSLTALAAAAEPITVIGIDTPIGNLPWGGRAADAAARARVGRLSSTVFNAIPTEALGFAECAAASAASIANGGQGIGATAWGLRTQMIEAAELAALDDRVIEVHPEVSFAALAGSALAWRKVSWNGATVRQRLLAEVGITFGGDLGSAGGACVDDLLDAAACAWSAQRYAMGIAVPLPEEVEVDAAGRRIAIWY